ncbi:MAG: glycosyltransferase [Ignisphaera sp.]
MILDKKRKRAAKIALLCTFSTVPRTLKMAKILANAGYDVHIIEWDRTGSKPRTEVKNGILFKRLNFKAGYGLKVFYLMPIWFMFVLIQVLIGGYHIIQPQNLDSLLPTLLATKIIRIISRKRRGRIIYDLADFYSDAYVADVPIISQLCAILERLLIRKVDAVILVSERQVLQVRARNLPQRVILFYNTPDENFTDDSSPLERGTTENVLTLFYAGSLSHDRISLLLNVIKAIKSLPVKIIVAGFGEYEDLIRRLSETNMQLVFLGYLEYEKIMKFAKRMDVILLPYDSRYINNRVGLPNKFFEAMACKCLILAPSNTYMGEIVEKNKIGITVDYNDPAAIRHAVRSILSTEKNTIETFKDRAKVFYIKRFNQQKINMKYLELVRSFV